MSKVKFNSNNSNGLKPLSEIDHTIKGTITVGQFLVVHNKFLNDKKLEGLSERTISDYLKHMKFFKQYILNIQRSNVDQCLIDGQFFKEYLYYMVMEKQYKPCTVNLRVSTLKCYCNWLYKNGYTKENYSLAINKVKRPQDTIKPLRDEDVKKMLNQPNRNIYAGFRDFTIMVILLDCGIRIQELCNTLVSDVDLKNATLNVRAVVSKTRKSRELPLGKQSVMLLKQLIDISVENKCNYVFMSSNTGLKLNYNVAIKNFEKYGKSAGIKVRCTPHVWRHTFATNAVKAGIDLFTLQKILGQNNITTTRQYVQLETSDLIKKHNKIDFVGRYLGGRR
ncbi:hypothetical protein AGR56_15750 [Clostridium sp. DMHC 10]|uniref:tyrosine-type recombinase/integrase n=1 Tax=Clostridium sp. DMHC 10 TaxID=747377 RepID=UPI00069F4CFB|nr:tyrosine-type recombinase/integrase [Clostridium sp. DMHC 10]KOF57717.1 hypothetical protein AGR56_15750 [Clostridium sp. DMHC 10]